MLSIHSVLQEHARYRPTGALPRNLGDGFLLEHNPMYRAVRREARRAGVRFTAERFAHYDVLPLTQLPKILKTRTVPYRDNVAPLKELERRAPRAFGLDEVPKLRPNHVFHESAHVVAHTAFAALPRARQEGERILRLLLEESYANACESFANVFSGSPLHDEFLYKNSYIMEGQGNRLRLARAIRQIGEHKSFLLLLCSFLYANFNQTRLARRQWPRLRKWLEVPASGDLEEALKIGFDLDPQFTLFTNAFCLKLEGLGFESLKSSRFEFLDRLEAEPRYRVVLEKLATRLFA